jgi:hypothetical protein
VKDSAENTVDKTYTLVIGEKPPTPTSTVRTLPVGEGNQKDLADLILQGLQ